MIGQEKKLGYEQAIVAIVLRSPDVFSKHDINAEWFSKWRGVIQAFFSLSAKGEEIDIFSIAEELKSTSVRDDLIHIVKNSHGAVGNLPKYIAGLRDMWRADALHCALESSMSCLAGGGSVDEVVSTLMQSTLKASTSETKRHEFSMKDAMGIFLDRLEETFEERDKGGIGLKTGLHDLDSMLGGMHPSDMIVVGARPGVGKTAFASTVLMNMAKSGVKVGFISTEMSASQVMLRFTAMDSGISGHRLRDASLGDSDWSLLTSTVNRLTNLPLRIYDKPNVTIADVSMQCKAWMIDGGLDFVVIDYLTRVKATKSSGNQVIDVGEVATGIKNIARQLNIPVMVLAQLNRAAAERRPMMSDLRDSGVIEQEADQILMLYRDKDNELAPAEILVEKNRHGESMAKIMCLFEKDTMRWVSMARGYEE